MDKKLVKKSWSLKGFKQENVCLIPREAEHPSKFGILSSNGKKFGLFVEIGLRSNYHP